MVTSRLCTLGFLYKYTYVLLEGKNVARLNFIFKLVVIKIPEAFIWFNCISSQTVLQACLAEDGYLSRTSQYQRIVLEVTFIKHKVYTLTPY